MYFLKDEELIDILSEWLISSDSSVFVYSERYDVFVDIKKTGELRASKLLEFLESKGIILVKDHLIWK